MCTPSHTAPHTNPFTIYCWLASAAGVGGSDSRMTRTITATVLDGWGRIIGGGVELAADGTVQALLPEPAEEPTSGEQEAASCFLIPGLVDVHCHGGGGASFPNDITPESIRRAARTHLERGTTTLIASTVSLDDPVPAITALADACDDGVLAGIHLEGPFISPCRAGAQDPDAIRPISLDALAQWLEAGRGWIRTVTIAPELENAVDAARLLLTNGAKPSWGHTDADGATVRSVIEQTTAIGDELGIRPAQTATHLFNAMPPLLQREPGPVRELLAASRRGECVVELIGDGVHLAPELVADLLTIDDQNPSGSGGAMLVTDAMAGAGMADGAYRLGALAVTIENGVARLTDGGAIAGGTSRLSDQLSVLAQQGVGLATLVHAVCAAPARALGLDVPSGATVGQPLTGVLLNENLQVLEVFHAGAVVAGSQQGERP